MTDLVYVCAASKTLVAAGITKAAAVEVDATNCLMELTGELDGCIDWLIVVKDHADVIGKLKLAKMPFLLIDSFHFAKVTENCYEIRGPTAKYIRETYPQYTALMKYVGVKQLKQAKG
jgi:hypothetical protein